MSIYLKVKKIEKTEGERAIIYMENHKNHSECAQLLLS